MSYKFTHEYTFELNVVKVKVDVFMSSEDDSLYENGRPTVQGYDEQIINEWDIIVDCGTLCNHECNEAVDEDLAEVGTLDLLEEYMDKNGIWEDILMDYKEQNQPV